MQGFLSMSGFTNNTIAGIVLWKFTSMQITGTNE